VLYQYIGPLRLIGASFHVLATCIPRVTCTCVFMYV
jgi:hypothetical protein